MCRKYDHLSLPADVLAQKKKQQHNETKSFGMSVLNLLDILLFVRDAPRK